MFINQYKEDFLMKCEICGASFEEGTVCPDCGYVNQKAEVKTKSEKSQVYGIVSLTCGILSYFTTSILAICAVVFAAIGKRKNGELDTMSQIGNILGIIHLIILGIALVFGVISTVLSAIIGLIGTVVAAILGLVPILIPFITELASKAI